MDLMQSLGEFRVQGHNKSPSRRISAIQKCVADHLHKKKQEYKNKSNVGISGMESLFDN